MKEYLLNLLDLRVVQLTTKINKIENRDRSTTATDLSGLNASIEEVRNEIEKARTFQERLKELDID